MAVPRTSPASRLAGLLVLVGLLVARDSAALTVSPSSIEIGSFFDGTTVHVTGTTGAETDVCVTITGRTVDEKFNRKGRLGPLWANVGSVTFSGAPTLLFVACSAPPRTLLDASTVESQLLDLDALAERTTVSPMTTDLDLMKRQYVRLKQEEGVVGVFDGAVHMAGAGTVIQFDAAIPWPAKAPAGEYSVRVLYLHDHAIVGQEQTELRVALAGMPKLVASLAFGRSALYGVLAVLVALAVGFLMGLIFKKGASH